MPPTAMALTRKFSARGLENSWCSKECSKMPRGGARPGSGPKKGAQYNRRWRLEVESAGPGQKPTAAQRTRALRRQICLCAADGMSVETIAAVLGFSVDKLKALFRRELQFGREIIRAEELARMGE